MKRLIAIFVAVSFAAQGFCQTPEELKSYLPPVQGWTIDSEIEAFNPDNLFNRINGAAPLFIENNFREMTSMTYTKGSDYIVIQAYRHATPADAFGMYTSERSPDMTFYSIGGEAQGDEMGLYFFAGSIYVKMKANNDTDEIGVAMREIGKGMAEKIDSSASYPAIFKMFPQEGKVQYTETYTTSGFLGHQFFNKVYSCKYGNGLQLLVVEEGAKELLDKYLVFTGQSAPDTSGRFVITDKYNGNMPAMLKGRYLVVGYDESGMGQGADLVDKFCETVKLQLHL